MGARVFDESEKKWEEGEKERKRVGLDDFTASRLLTKRLLIVLSDF